jgi:hypothetical protein
VPWFFMPYCESDHALFHLLCRRAGIDFKSRPPNKPLAYVRVLKAILVATWMVVDMLEKHLGNKSTPTTDGGKP